MIDPIREAEVEASIAATNAECEAESNARGIRKNIAFIDHYGQGRPRPAYTPRRISQWASWYLRHPFALDLVSCEETNS